MAKTHITAEQAAQIYEYNPETGTLKRRSTGLFIRNVGSNRYLQCTFRGKKYLVHRVAWMIYYGEIPADNIDHMNGNRLDNRIVNLRNASRTENAQNGPTKKTNNKAGFRGVTLKRGGMYAAKIKVSGSEIYLGRFASAGEAHQAYLNAKLKYHPSWVRED